MDFASGLLRLSYRHDGIGWFQSLAVATPRRPVVPLAAPVPDACTLTLAASPQTVKIRPIGFHSDVVGSGPPTGKSAGAQIADATAIWEKCCIEILPLEPISLPRGDLMTSDDPELVAAVTADPDPQVVEVFVVRNPLIQFGGGATVGAGTNAAKVVLSEDGTGGSQRNLLAHELGHVLSGMHPGELPTIHFWTGQSGTVLQPASSSFPDIPSHNTLANCDSARNPVIVTLPTVCCRTPDGET